jgi:hypothetical protein
MRKIILTALVLAGAFLFVPAAHAQFTAVTATVVDPNGIPYGNGTMSAVLVPASPGGWRLSGQPYSGRIGPLTLDATGSFSTNFGSNALITPAGSQWQITVNSNQGGIAPPLGTGAQTFVVTMTISGASQNISATLDAAAPKLTNITVGSGSVTSVSGTAPIVATPNPIIGIGAISCPTCNTSSATIGGAITVGQEGYGSATNTLAGTTKIIDMTPLAGADLGAKMNACVALLPSGNGICRGDNLPTSQTLSTLVAATGSVVFTFCGQQVTQSNPIELMANDSWVKGCPGGSTTFTQTSAANPQVIEGANDDGVEWINWVGNASSTVDIIDLFGIGDQVLNNTIGNFSLNGININLMSGSINGSPTVIKGNTITSATTSTGSDIVETAGDGATVIVSENSFFVQSATSFCLDNQGGGGAPVLFTNNTCQFIGASAGAVNLNGGTMTGNFITTLDDMANFHSTTNPLVTCGGPCSIGGNFIAGAGDPGIGRDGQPCILIANGVGGASELQTSITGNILSNCGGQSGTAAILLTDTNFATAFAEVEISGNTIRVGDSDGTHDTYGILLNITNASSTVGSLNITGNVLLDFITPDTHGVAIAIFNPNSVAITGLDVNENTIENFDRGILDTNVGAASLKNNRFNNTTTPYAGTFSSTEKITDITTAFTNATLPAIANGSLLYCSDCKSTTPTAASGSGTIVTRFNSVWGGGMIDSTGLATAAKYATATNCTSAASPAVCGSAAAGTVVIAAAATTVVVDTTAVTANSEIFIQYDSSLGTKLSVTCNTTVALPAITARTGGTSFTITVPAAPAVNPACYSYHIVN